MLDRFQEKFKEEALDNVASIEESLFEIENDPENKELIEKLFRSMHTIKGGGAMFGFNDLSNFTHNLETIYDLIRNDKLKVDKDIISLTFESLDYIKQLLDIGELTDPDDIAKQKDYIARIQKYFGDNDLGPKGPKVGAQAAPPPPPKPKVPEKKNYLVLFEPFDSLLNNGTNPFFIIDDLTAMGDWKSVAYIGGVKNFKEQEPLCLHIKWQVILQTDQDINDIKDVFIFVEDECKVEIEELVDGNIVGNTDKVPQMLQDAAEKNELLKVADFVQFKEEPKPEPKPDPKPEPKSEAKKEDKPAGGGAAKQPDNKNATMRVATSKIDDLVNAVSELVTMQAQLSLLAEKQKEADLSIIAEQLQMLAEKENNSALTAISDKFNHLIENHNSEALSSVSEQMEKLARTLRDNSFELSLIPLQGELVRYQRLVRDLSNKLGKQLEFVVEGGDIELDKNIIEHIIDPLLHIIRNSGDHGIEMPDERIAKGKDPKGTILLKAFYSGSSVIMQVSDDGKGMNPDVIFKKAVEKGVVSANAKLSKSEILNLVFASGFSTAEKVSDVSGRGVGMDVVKSKIAEIRGEVTIDSEIDKGTTITLNLPLSLSIIDGLLALVNNEQFVFPKTSIEHILQTCDVEFTQSSMSNVFIYEKEQIMYLDLNEYFYKKPTDRETGRILLVRHGEKQVGIIVDQIVDEYQIVVKPLGKYMRKMDMISGASVMGDGSLSLIIDSTRLINRYNHAKNQKEIEKEKQNG